jgi:hypothetical protein
MTSLAAAAETAITPVSGERELAKDATEDGYGRDGGHAHRELGQIQGSGKVRGASECEQGKPPSLTLKQDRFSPRKRVQGTALGGVPQRPRRGEADICKD